MTMVGLISPNRQNPVPDRTNNSISIHPKADDCEYCHAYNYSDWEKQFLNESYFCNDEVSDWGKYIPVDDEESPMLRDTMVIRISDMRLYSEDPVNGLCPTNATHCPMCGRKLREDV